MDGGQSENSGNDADLHGSGATPIEPGDPPRIGPFRLLGVLGTGGMGRVYLGSSAGRYAAVKQVLPALAVDPDFLRHFGHELDNLGKLPSGVSARLLASDRTAGPPWFATEFIPGVTLNDALRLHGGPLPADSLWRLLRDGAKGLRGVHAADMVHRDLKPSNVMLTDEGVTLIDFGVARAADQSRLTRTGMVIGTPAYMAPEQAVADRRQLTGAADVFAFASLLLYAANGRPPFGDGAGPDLLYRIVHTEPELGRLPGLDPELSALVESCLAKDPAARPTAVELAERARDHVPAESGAPWPSAVMDRITERLAFAARPPAAEPAGPKQDEGGASRPAADGATSEPDVTGPAARKPRERRTRVLMVAIPAVVAVATTVTIALAPYDGHGSDHAGPSASMPSVSPSSSKSAASDPSPTPTASSSRKPPAKHRSPSAKPGGSGASGGSGGSGSGGRSTSGDGSGGSGGSGGASGSGSSGGSGGAGGSSGGQNPAPSGQHQLKNASTGRCLAENAAAYGGSMVMNSVCGEPAGNGATNYYQWTYRPTSGGMFKLVSQGTGGCLRSNGYAGLVIERCSASEAQVWKIGDTTSNGRTLINAADGNCLQMYSYGSGGTTMCNRFDTSQLWRNA